MKRSTSGVVKDAFSVTAVAVVSIYLMPQLEEKYPEIPEWLLFTIPVFLTSLLTFALWAKATSVATLKLGWIADKQNNIEITQLIIDINERTKESSDQYWLKVKLGPSSGLGLFALRLGVWAGLGIKVEGLHSSLVILPEEDGPQRTRTMVEDQPGCAIRLKLFAPIPDVETEWASARVLFRGRSKRPVVNTTIDYTVSGPNWLAKVCGKMIRVDPSVKNMIENWY